MVYIGSTKGLHGVEKGFIWGLCRVRVYIGLI